MTKNDGYVGQRLVNLLLIAHSEDVHYMAITDLVRLLSSQANGNEQCKHVCLNCLQLFNSGSPEIATMSIAQAI